MAFSKLFLAVCSCILVILQTSSGVPIPKPQVLPGQIPPHLATHPALSSVTQGRESTLMQYAYNIQNRRGPSPSPLVLQNNQERNLQLVNQLSQQRSGQSFIPSAGGHVPGGNENPERRALEVISQYKQGGSLQNSYNPAPLTPAGTAQPYLPPGAHHHHHPGGIGQSGIHPDDNESEDIRKLKSILNLSGRPLPGSPGGSPTIGVAGERGVLNPAQYAQHPSHGHDHHHHPTPFPQTAQSQNSLGNLQFGSPRPSIYPGTNPTPVPSVHVPYGDSHGHSHGHDHPGQDARTLIQSLETPSEAYQNLVYIDPIREPSSINKHVGPHQSVFILPASDYVSDDYQRLLNRPAEILIDVIPAPTTSGKQDSSTDFSLHNFSLLLTPSTYARCAQSTHKRGYGGKCKIILKVGRKGNSSPQPVQVSY